jgi:hypothetical protein
MVPLVRSTLGFLRITIFQSFLLIISTSDRCHWRLAYSDGFDRAMTFGSMILLTTTSSIAYRTDLRWYLRGGSPPIPLRHIACPNLPFAYIYV